MTTAASPDLFADAGDIRVCYRTYGDVRVGRPLLLIHGLGQQLTRWTPAFLDRLVEAGYALVVPEHRDAGLSTFTTGTPPDLLALATGRATPGYRMADLADDAFAVLDAVGWPEAHVVGVSMGGMVAQEMAIRQPARVRSLTSVMSNTGDPGDGRADREIAWVLRTPPPADLDGYLAHSFETWQLIGSPGFPFDADEARRAALAAYRRNPDTSGAARQLAAIVGSPDRRPGLATVGMPALVVHGTADRLVHVDGGEATAAAIPGARLLLVEGMGHDLPAGMWPRFLEALAEVTSRGDAAVLPS